MPQVLADAHHGLVQCQTGLDADNGQVKSVRQTDCDEVLAFLDEAFQHEPWQKETKSWNPNQQEQGIAAHGQNNGKPKDGHSNSAANVHAQMAGIAISGLNQPGAGS